MVTPESSLGSTRIEDHFAKSFFRTNFWFMWCTTFAFEPWHSAVEFRRYALRFLQEFPRINTLAGVRRTPLNQHDSIVVPLVEWLKGQGVQFVMNCEVTNLSFSQSGQARTVENVYYMRDGRPLVIPIRENDLAFVTIGSMTAGSTLGSMTSAPRLGSKRCGGAWTLWKNIAKNHTEFGRPSAFDDHVDQSKWESFTVTFRDPFFQRMEKSTGNPPGTGGLVTFKDSHWLMSVFWRGR
jgi:oleate hydratase